MRFVFKLAKILECYLKFRRILQTFLGTPGIRARPNHFLHGFAVGLTTTLLVLEGTPLPGSSGIAWAIRKARSSHQRSALRSITRAGPRNRVRELDLPQSRRSYRTPNQPPSNIITSLSTAPDRFLFNAREREVVNLRN